MTGDNYFIYGDDGRKFCERYVDDKGEIHLQTKTESIALTKIIMLASNPGLARKQRGKVTVRDNDFYL